MNLPAQPSRDTVPALDAAQQVRQAIAATEFPFNTPTSQVGREVQRSLTKQLDDYIVPRYRRSDAPLLTVVGGSTGAGKSAIVNGLVGAPISKSSAIRPTTRRPVLVHHPLDTDWFNNTRILTDLARVRRHGEHDDSSAHRELEIRGATAMPRGLALIDAPDIDSLIDNNRRLAGELMAAADVWIFVTTAARYADAVPWKLLQEAAERRVVVAIVLNRVPYGVAAEVRADLADRLAETGLHRSPLFTISEADLSPGEHLDPNVVAPVGKWLADLAMDAPSRTAIARRSLAGAVDALIGASKELGAASADQVAMWSLLNEAVDDSYQEARTETLTATSNGALLRGEILSRFQGLVGTGEILRNLDVNVGPLRDRVGEWFRGSDTATEPESLTEAIESAVVSVLVAQSQQAWTRTESAWLDRLGDEQLIALVRSRANSGEHFRAACQTQVRQWHQGINEMVTDHGAGHGGRAQELSVSADTVGAALMVIVLAATGSVPGRDDAEVGGGAAAVAQSLLAAVLGDEAVRTMVTRSRQDLDRRIGALFESHAEPWRGVLREYNVDPTQTETLREAMDSLARARRHEVGQ